MRGLTLNKWLSGGVRAFTITNIARCANRRPLKYTMHGPWGNHPNNTKYLEVENIPVVYDHGGNDDQPRCFA